MYDPHIFDGHEIGLIRRTRQFAEEFEERLITGRTPIQDRGGLTNARSQIMILVDVTTDRTTEKMRAESDIEVGLEERHSQNQASE